MRILRNIFRYFSALFLSATCAGIVLAGLLLALGTESMCASQISALSCFFRTILVVVFFAVPGGLLASTIISPLLIKVSTTIAVNNCSAAMIGMVVCVAWYGLWAFILSQQPSLMKSLPDSSIVLQALFAHLLVLPKDSSLEWRIVIPICICCLTHAVVLTLFLKRLVLGN